MLRLLERVDRRIIFLLMALAVGIPVLFNPQFPESPGELSTLAFDEIERLPAGSRVLLAFDYDPGSEGELQPMANAFMHHCASRHLKLYFLSLWPAGDAKCQETIEEILNAYHPEYKYGEDYVQLGFKAGNEGVIKVSVTDLKQSFPTDARGTPLEKIPAMEGVGNLQAMDLVITISAGWPGSKEWAQYYAAAFPAEHLITGTTGVQSVTLYAYIPHQIRGMLAAIKGAAEYEAMVNEKYPGPDGKPLPRLRDGQLRMGPQLSAHLLMIALIILGNVVYFATRSAARRPRGGSR